jgi:bifunctional non-homologous end joining protein LigD
MHACPYPTPFDDDEWLYELKVDGYRCLADGPRLMSRNGKPYNAFPEVSASVAKLHGDLALDSELSVDDEHGFPRFDRLQARARMSDPRRVRAAAEAEPARLYVFDILAYNGRDLRGLTLLERKRILRDVIPESDTIIFVNGIVGAGCRVFDEVERIGLEGMVAKRLESTYRKGRSRDWLKIKYAGYGRRAALGFGRK